jgi:hypothetical protein
MKIMRLSALAAAFASFSQPTPRLLGMRMVDEAPKLVQSSLDLAARRIRPWHDEDRRAGEIAIVNESIPDDRPEQHLRCLLEREDHEPRRHGLHLCAEQIAAERVLAGVHLASLRCRSLEIGEIWDLEYADRPGATAPHLEDVIVQARSGRRRGRQENLASLVLERDEVWTDPAELFDGRLMFTAGGSAYVPVAGPLPTRSTGYWRPAHDLTRDTVNDKPRYRWTGSGDLRSIRYVGVADPDPVIPAGSVVRLSLPHPFTPPDGPGGYWLQLSGWYRT